MPIQIRQIINNMLEKNPDNRADWDKLKKFEFFSNSTALT